MADLSVKIGSKGPSPIMPGPTAPTLATPVLGEVSRPFDILFSPTWQGGLDFGGYRPQLYTTYGMNTVGGRGPGSPTPVVIRVNTLSDSGGGLTLNGDGTYSGPFRAACLYNGPRFVVFERSGYIDLSGDLKNVPPYLTIAGQTAPSPGIALRYYGLNFYDTHDLMLQHFRVRPGWIGNPDGTNANCNSSGIFWTSAAPGSFNIVCDHMSFSWGLDENVGVFNSNARMTFWRSITSESLHQTPGSAGCTGAAEDGHGFLVYASTHGVAVLQSLTAHNVQRNPYWEAGTAGLTVNNIIYDWYKEWGIFCSSWDAWGVGDRHFFVTAIGNRFIRGPHTVNPNDGNVAWMFYYDDQSAVIQSGNQIYRRDNTVTNDPDGKVIDEYNNMGYDPNVGTIPTAAPLPPNYTPLASSSLEQFLLPMVGARPLDRDSVDARIASEVLNRTHVYGWYPRSQDDVGGYGTLAQNSRPYALPSNPFAIASGQSFRTNLEMDLEAKAQALEP